MNNNPFPAGAMSPATGNEVFAGAAPFIDERYGEEEPVLRIDLRALWSALYRNRYLIAAIVAIALLLGLAATLLMTKIYRAEASVQIEQQASRVLESQDVEPVAAIQDADRFLETQLDVVRSRYLAEKVAQDLNLFGNDEFLAAQNIEPAEPSGSDLSPEEAERTLVLDTLQENLSVALPLNSRIARIRFDSPDPALAARVANSFAANFISSNLERKFEMSSYARDFLSSQLAEAKQRLEDSERQLIAYARQAGLIDTSGGVVDEQQRVGPRSLTTSALVQLSNEHATAVNRRIQAQERWQQASRTSAMNLPAVLENLAVQELVQQRAEQEALYRQELQRRREDFPSVRQAAARIAELDRQIATLAGNIKSSIRQEYQIALQQERALAGNVDRLKMDTMAEQDRAVRYNILKREVDTNREMYEGLLQRYKEVRAAAGITANNISMLDVAEVPTDPVSPKPVINMALAGFGGLCLALLLVFARERFDDVIRSPDDIEAKLGVAPLGIVPVLRDGQAPEDALSEPRSEMSEAYQALRTSLELASATGMPGSLLITSSQQSEGKSTTAYAVARDFARIGRKIVLVDADLRKPSLHRMLSLPNANGLSGLLAGQRKLADVVQKGGEANLDIITTGPLPPNPAELLAAPSLENLLLSLAATYDLVVVDAPPVMGLSDAPLLASRVDGTVFVVEANRAHRGQAKIALRRLSSTRARLLGAVLTKFDAQSIGYGQDYGYGYRYGQ